MVRNPAGDEVGPVKEEGVLGLVQAGKLNLSWLARPSDSDEWAPLGDYPAFMAVAPVPVAAPTSDPGLSSERLWRAVLIIGAVAFMGAMLGFFFPVFSDRITKSFCSLDTPLGERCRSEAMRTYGMAGALVGVVLALVNDQMAPKEKT